MRSLFSIIFVLIGVVFSGYILTVAIHTGKFHIYHNADNLSAEDIVQIDEIFNEIRPQLVIIQNLLSENYSPTGKELDLPSQTNLIKSARYFRGNMLVEVIPVNLPDYSPLVFLPSTLSELQGLPYEEDAQIIWQCIYQIPNSLPKENIHLCPGWSENGRELTQS